MTHVVLVGPMGAGKSTVGRRLAAALGRPFVDNDVALEAREGRTAAAVQATDGRAALHAAELAVLRDALAGTAPAVVAAAASVVDTDAGLDLLRTAAAVVWLRATPAELAGRVRAGGHRPPPPADAAGREPRFAAVATVAVDARRPAGELAIELADALIAGDGGRC